MIFSNDTSGIHFTVVIFSLLLLCIISCSSGYKGGKEVPYWEWTEERSSLDWKIEYLIENGRFEAALALTDSIIAIASRDPRVLAQKARALAGLGRDDEALAHFEEAILGDYECCESHVNFAVFLMDKGKIGRAITEFKVAKRFCAGDNMAIIHRNLAVVNIKQGKLDAALEEVFAGLNLKPEDPYLLGLEAMLVSDTNPILAESLFVRLRRAGKTPPEHLHTYGLLLLKTGRSSKAVEVLEQAYEHNPEEHEIRLNLGMAYNRAGNFDDAERLLRELITEGVNGRATKELASVLFRAGRFAEALELYMDLPPSADVMDRIAMCHRELGNLDDALEWSRKAVNERPNWPTAMVNLAVILAARGELDEAAILLEQVLQIAPDHATARINLERLRSTMEEAK